MGLGMCIMHACLPCACVTDYELQLQILEAVFRVSDAKQRDLLAKMCFKDQQLAIELKSINPKELDVVCSLYCDCAQYNNIVQHLISRLSVCLSVY